MHARPLLAVLLMLASTCAAAHGGLPSAEWCEGGRITVVSEFVFTSEGLRPGNECPAGARSTRDCGQFDDDYGRARSAANDHCGQFAYDAAPSKIADLGSAIPLVESPSSYLDDQHHQTYSITQGLSGTCLRCDLPMRPILQR